MEGRCTECGNDKVALHHYLDHLCYNCHEKMFRMPNPFEDKTPVEEEPDFELEHDTAIVKVSSDLAGVNYLKLDSQLLYAGTITFPKKYVFNPDARAKDYEKLVEFILHNMHITDKAPGFDKVSWMFKEVE